MKTNLIKIFSFLLLAGLLNSCEKKCKCDDEPFTAPDGTFCYKDNGRPGNMLKYKEIVNMLQHYDSTRKNVLKKSLGREDTRINFYSITELRDYMAYIEGLCKEKEIELTGINIISAAYPDNYQVNPASANKQTLIFMPTTTIDGETVTFDPLQSSLKNPVAFKDLLSKFNYNWPYDGKKIVSKSMMQKGDLESSGSNRMGITPPPY